MRPNSKVSALLSMLSSYFTTIEQYKKIKRYANKLEQVSARFSEAVQDMDKNLKWTEKNMPIIVNSIEQFMFG